jgi:hypothetical protein
MSVEVPFLTNLSYATPCAPAFVPCPRDVCLTFAPVSLVQERQ